LDRAKGKPFEDEEPKTLYERRLTFTEARRYFLYVGRSARQLFPSRQTCFRLRHDKAECEVRMDSHGRILIGAYFCSRLSWRTGALIVTEKLANREYKIREVPVLYDGIHLR